MRELAPGKGDMVKRVTSIPMLHDIEARIRMMEEWPGYQQVLTLPNPPLESIAGPGDPPALARLANDELQRICAARPNKFPAWVASLPLNNVEASLAEIDRAVAAGARGIQIFTNVDGRPLDDPEFSRFSSTPRPGIISRFGCIRRATRGLPIIAANRSRNTKSGRCSAGPTRPVWRWRASCFPACSTACPSCASSPHLGAMIPYFAGRVGPLWDQLGSRTSDEDYTPILAAMTARGRRPIDYFRLFYNDTAVGGAGSAIRCGLIFFGADRVLFATDCPFDPEGGPMFHPRHYRCDRRPRPRRGGARENLLRERSQHVENGSGIGEGTHGYCAALAVFCRIRSISPWIWPPWRWMTEANSERWVTAMLTPSTMTSLIL